MTVYMIAEITVTNDSWISAYAQDVHTMVERHGGRYLSRSANIATIEGAKKEAALVALFEFPARANVDAFVRSPEYQPYIKARQAGSTSVFYVIDDTDVAGTIPYLKAG